MVQGTRKTLWWLGKSQRLCTLHVLQPTLDAAKLARGSPLQEVQPGVLLLLLLWWLHLLLLLRLCLLCWLLCLTCLTLTGPCGPCLRLCCRIAAAAGAVNVI
jgi:hypothetical protein